MLLIDSKKSKIYRKNFYSYFLVFFIPFIIFSIIIYTSIVKNTEDNTIKTVKKQLELIMNIYDTNIKELYALSTVIYRNTNYSFGDFNNRTRIQKVNELKVYNECNLLLEDVVLYSSNDKDHIYTSMGVSDLDTFINNTYKFNKYGNGKFLEYLKSIQAPKFVSQDKETNGENKQSLMMYFFPSTTDSLYNQLNLFFVINRQEFYSPLKRVLVNENESTFVLDENNNIIMSVSNFGFDRGALLEFLKQSQNKGTNEFIYNNKKFSVFKLKSDETGWTYISVKNSNALNKNLNTLKILMSIIIIILFICGVMFVLTIQNKNYRPLYNLITNIEKFNKIKNTDSLNDDNQRDEYEYIENMFFNIQSTNAFLKEKIKGNSEMLIHSCLLKLLIGESSEMNSVCKQLNQLGIDFEFSYFQVCVVSINKSIEKTDELYNFIENIKLYNTHIFIVDLILEDKIAIIFNIDFPKQDKIHFKSIENIVKLKFIQIAVGRVYKGVESINESYLEACTALEYKSQLNEKEIIYFDEVEVRQDDITWDVFSEKMKFVQSIKRGSKEIAIELLHQRLNTIKNTQASFLIVRYMCFEIINILFNIINETKSSVPKDEIKELLVFKTVDQLEISLQNVIGKICMQMKNTKDDRGVELMNKIICDIEENYTNSNYGLNIIAEKFNLSVSSLSRFVKQYTDSNFTDLISDLRIERAKQLLIKTDKTINTIVEEIGYIDSSNFNRKFKSIVGMTPDQYRKLNKKTE